MGDMNKILFPFEKEGGNVRPQHFMQAFRDVIDDCNLSDFGYVGENSPGIGVVSERDWIELLLMMLGIIGLAMLCYKTLNTVDLITVLS